MEMRSLRRDNGRLQGFAPAAGWDQAAGFGFCRIPLGELDQTASPSERSMAPLGCAPMTAAEGSPPLNRIIVGIEAIP